MYRIRTLLLVLAFIAALIGFLPLLPYLGIIPKTLFFAAIVWTVVAERKRIELPGRIATVFSFMLFLYYFFQFDRNNFIGPATDLLVVFLAIRVASEKSPRNFLQILGLSIFTLAASALYTLSPLFLLYLLLMILVTGIALVILTFYMEEHDATFTPAGMKNLLSIASLIPLLTLPLMFLFFVILPRSQYPLWDFLNKASRQTPGLSDKVRPGSSSTGGEGGNIVFRAESPLLPLNRLYWRGIVFNSYDGRAWTRRDPPAKEVNKPIAGETVRQTIFPEPGQSSYVVALNVPQEISGVRQYPTRDRVYTRTSAGTKRGKYETLSASNDTIETPLGIDRKFYLAVPSAVSPTIVDLGQEISIAGNDVAIVQRLENFFRAGHYAYATSGLPISEDPLAEFLFSMRKGNCEFFASSAGLILRLAGVPARLVGGYFGGHYNDLGGYYAVTDEMAHVWVEAYIEGRGWVTIDPSGWSDNFSSIRERSGPGFARKARILLDSLGYYWNLAVINYDLEQQLQLVNRANLQLKQWALPAVPRFSFWLLFPVATALLLPLIFRRWNGSPEERVLKQFLDTLRKKYGYALPTGKGLHDICMDIKDTDVSRFVTLYGRVVYNDRKLDRDEQRVLLGILRKIRQS